MRLVPVWWVRSALTKAADGRARVRAAIYALMPGRAWKRPWRGAPKFDYEFWHDHLRPLGFNLKAEVLEYPEGMPGDIGLILSWK